jgi:hypothetical protein
MIDKNGHVFDLTCEKGSNLEEIQLCKPDDRNFRQHPPDISVSSSLRGTGALY